MDISKTYIKMCEEAEEIQKLFGTPLPPGTFWVRKSEDSYFEGITGYGYKRLPEWIILPRQDQLQEIFIDYHKRREPCFEATFRDVQVAVILRSIAKFNEERFHKSMEQLWLAFVMKKNYHKIYDGKNWIVEVIHERT